MKQVLEKSVLPEKPVVLEKAVYGGDCLAHLPVSNGKQGKAVFVPLTLPGETVTLQAVENNRKFLKAELNKILTPSPQRVEPRCPHFGSCGGCHYQHADYPAQLAMKEQILRETLTRAGVATPAEVTMLSANPWAYRNRIRLAVTPDFQIGYRSRRSHEIVPITQCPIAAPGLIETAQTVAQFLHANPIPNTGPNTDLTPIAEIEIFSNPTESRQLVTLFSEGLVSVPAHIEWLNQLRSKLPLPNTGLWLRSDRGNKPGPAATMPRNELDYRVAGFDYHVDHGAFFQVNRWLLDAFVACVVPVPIPTSTHKPKTAWDLYAGVGLFARQLAAVGFQVTAVESAPESQQALQKNLLDTGAQAINSTTLDFLHRNRELRQPRPDCIVLDPPRAGLGAEVTTLLNAIAAPSVTYVSCDPTTLARDLRALTQERYRIDSVTLVDVFPQTFHIETVVKLSRT